MATIYLVGLGPGGKEGLTLGAMEVLEKVSPLLLKTRKHSVVSFLKEKGISFETLDHLSEQADACENICERIASLVVNKAVTAGKVAYALPGHPLEGERSVKYIYAKARRAKVKLEVIGGESLIEVFMGILGLDFSQGITILNASELDPLQDLPREDLLIYQADNPLAASKVQEKLTAYFPADYPVTLVTIGQAVEEAEINKIPLHALDSQKAGCPSALYVPALPGGLGSLLKLMETLRGTEGCPWDREQDHRSLRPYVLEEAYEVVDAINKGDQASLVEELGDLLLQVVFHAQIAREEGAFNIYHVIEGIAEKIIRRHPHVFGSLKLANSKEVLKTWQEIKEGENKARGDLAKTGRELPALLRANKIQSQAAALGFDWPDIKGASEKLAEELKELKIVYNTADSDKIEEELGDVFFALVNVSRFLYINPEVALAAANDKFCRRFSYIEKQVKKRGGDFSQFSLEQLDAWWEEAKKISNDGKK